MNGHPENVAAALPELAGLLHGACDAAVTTAVVALGHAWDDRALEVVLAARLGDHDSPRVRLAVAQALGGGLPAPDVRARAVAALLGLTTDLVPEVRNWACFGLRQLNADGLQVQDALAARLDDQDGETRDEALVALARTGDPRALARIGQALRDPDDRSVMLLQVQSVVELAAPELMPVLEQLDREWSGDEDQHTSTLARALRRSTPAAADRATALERRLETAVNERLADRAQSVFLQGSYPRTTLHFRTEDPQQGWWRRLWDDHDPDSLDLTYEVKNWVHNAP